MVRPFIYFNLYFGLLYRRSLSFGCSFLDIFLFWVSPIQTKKRNSQTPSSTGRGSINYLFFLKTLFFMVYFTTLFRVLFIFLSRYYSLLVFLNVQLFGVNTPFTQRWATFILNHTKTQLQDYEPFLYIFMFHYVYKYEQFISRSFVTYCGNRVCFLFLPILR